jgi:hypothetical protein
MTQTPISFPFQGTFQEFLAQVKTLTGKKDNQFAYSESSVRNMTRNGGPYPRKPENLKIIYTMFQVQALTGKAWKWFFNFASFPECDPDLNPELQEAITLPATLRTNLTKLHTTLESLSRELKDVLASPTVDSSAVND